MSVDTGRITAGPHRPPDTGVNRTIGVTALGSISALLVCLVRVRGQLHGVRAVRFPAR